MKFKQLILLSSTLMLLASCTTEVGVDQPVSETVSSSPSVESPSAEVAAPTDPTAPASDMADAADTVLKSGSFIAGEVPTEGMAQVITENGERYLELDQSFTTSDRGPDLFVILHRSDDVLGSTEPPAYPLQEQDYVILGPLQEFSGAQRYPIPEDVNLDDYQSAVIWCRQFNATFGVAQFDS